MIAGAPPVEGTTPMCCGLPLNRATIALSSGDQLGDPVEYVPFVVRSLSPVPLALME